MYFEMILHVRHVLPEKKIVLPSETPPTLLWTLFIHDYSENKHFYVIHKKAFKSDIVVF